MSIAEQNELEAFRIEGECKLEKVRCCSQLSIEQYKSLRTEIDDTIKDTRNLELYAIAGVVAYYAWLFTQTKEVQSSAIFWLVPFAAAALGVLRVWSNVKQLLTAASYIRKVEEYFNELEPGLSIGPEMGWESYLRIMRTSKGSHLRISPPCKKETLEILIVGWESFYWQFWIIMILFTLILPALNLIIK